MNKNLSVIIALIVIAVGGGFTYLLLQDKPAENPKVTQKQDTKLQTTLPAEQPTEAAGTYREYSENAIAETLGTKILFFHASWCPQCRQLETDIKDGKIPHGVTIFKVDYDNSQKLRQKYGITLQTTLVKVDDSGNEVKKFVAYDEPSLDALIRNLL